MSEQDDEQQEENCEIVTVEDFVNQRECYEKACSFLDDYHANNYIKLGEWLAKKGYIESQNFYFLKNNHHGGGSPALAFLDALPQSEHMNLKVKEFEEVALGFKRYDIIEFITEQKISKDILLRKLSLNLRTKMAELLDRRVPSLKDWTYFASKYGFNHTEINAFNMMRPVPGEFSPTKMLFQKILTQNKSLDINCIKNGLSSDESGLKMNNVNDVIDEAIQNILKKRKPQMPTINTQDTGIDDEETNVATVMLPPENIKGIVGRSNNNLYDAVDNVNRDEENDGTSLRMLASPMSCTIQNVEGIMTNCGIETSCSDPGVIDTRMNHMNLNDADPEIFENKNISIESIGHESDGTEPNPTESNATETSDSESCNTENNPNRDIGSVQKNNDTQETILLEIKEKYKSVFGREPVTPTEFLSEKHFL